MRNHPLSLIWICVAVISILLLTNSRGYTDETIVRYPVPESEDDKRYEYPRELLEIALRKTVNTHGPFVIRDAEKKAPKVRNGAYLKQGENIDIIWHAENGNLEDDFLPIRVPLLKGLIGYRVFLIRQTDQEKFSSVKTLDDLRKFTAGFGHAWADRSILEANNIRVDATAQYELLFKKLALGRFDYFPRGVNEAWLELQNRKELYPDMTVESSLLLYYRMPIYFIVNKQNQRLAERVETGLRKAIDDGSFDEVFFQYHEAIIRNANLNGRTLLTLENPNIPFETPIDKKFWFHRTDIH